MVVASFLPKIQFWFIFKQPHQQNFNKPNSKKEKVVSFSR